MELRDGKCVELVEKLDWIKERLEDLQVNKEVRKEVSECLDIVDPEKRLRNMTWFG